MAEGRWEPGFDEVVALLDAQVAESESGGAVCVYHRGRPVGHQPPQITKR